MPKQRRIIAADCETDPFENGRVIRPFIWGAYDGDEYNEFDKTSDFVAWAKEQDAIIYAHNGGKFDWHFIKEDFEPHSRIMTIAGRVAKIPFGKAELRDSYSILPVPLREMEKDEFDYSLLHESVRHLHMPAIRKYLRSDCEGLYRWVSEFINQYGRNLTLASAALAQWKKISGMDAPRSTSAFYNEFAPFYYGGRVQCFQTGEINKPFKVIDINSAYPAAMMQRHAWGTDYIELVELPKTGVERCFIELEADSLGAFPIRTDTGLDFPADGLPRDFFVTGWEYLAARDTGHLRNAAIKRVCVFTSSIEFSDYVDHFYEIKSESVKGSPAYLFAKLFLNSLYGKFGANPSKYKEQTIIPRDQIAAHMVYEGAEYAGDIGPWALMEKPLNEKAQRYFNVATAASITGYVRAFMRRALAQCKGIIYCDTDSIAAEDIGALELDPVKLGAWDVEAVCDYAAVVAKKIYAFRKNDGTFKTASKGVRLTSGQIIEAARGATVLHKNDAPTFSLKKAVDMYDPDEVQKLYIQRNVRMNH